MPARIVETEAYSGKYSSIHARLVFSAQRFQCISRASTPTLLTYAAWCVNVVRRRPISRRRAVRWLEPLLDRLDPETRRMRSAFSISNRPGSLHAPTSIAADGERLEGSVLLTDATRSRTKTSSSLLGLAWRIRRGRLGRGFLPGTSIVSAWRNVVITT